MCVMVRCRDDELTCLGSTGSTNCLLWNVLYILSEFPLVKHDFKSVIASSLDLARLPELAKVTVFFSVSSRGLSGLASPLPDAMLELKSESVLFLSRDFAVSVFERSENERKVANKLIWFRSNVHMNFNWNFMACRLVGESAFVSSNEQEGTTLFNSYDYLSENDNIQWQQVSFLYVKGHFYDTCMNLTTRDE